MWIEDTFDVEPGIGVALARDNASSDPLWEPAKDHLRHGLSLFLLRKNSADIVYAPRCGVLMTSSLEHIETNTKILDAFTAGLPIILSADVMGCSIGDSLPAYLSPSRHDEYRRDRERFQDAWQLSSHRLREGDQYFTTHTRAGGKLGCIAAIEAELAPRIGEAQEVGNALPRGKAIDFVVVPTLRTTSRNFELALGRQPSTPVIRSYDLIDRHPGDEVPAWLWTGGPLWLYPRKWREGGLAIDA